MPLDLRPTLRGAREYLGSVLVGVLLAPVLPDVAVDLFGGAVPQGDAVLRVAALAVVLAGCLVTFRIQLALARRRVRRGGHTLGGIGPADTVVVPIGFRSIYHPRTKRTGEMSVLDWLVDATGPSTVIGITTPQVRAKADRLESELAADGIAFHTLEIRDAGDPAVAVADADRLVTGMLGGGPLGDRTVAVDTTGGSVPMSIAMLRVAALLGATCTYVSSQYEKDRIVPGSQRGYSFDPSVLLVTPPITDQEDPCPPPST